MIATEQFWTLLNPHLKDDRTNLVYGLQAWHTQPAYKRVLHQWYLFSSLQIGTFTTQHGEYFLEPLLNVAGEEYDEEHKKPHLVYRNERKKNVSSPGEACAASGNRQPNHSTCNHHLWFSPTDTYLFITGIHFLTDGNKVSTVFSHRFSLMVDIKYFSPWLKTDLYFHSHVSLTVLWDENCITSM